MGNKKLMYWSLVVGFVGYNLWPFLWTDVFYQATNVQKLFVAVIVVNLSKSDVWLNRGAWINLLFAGMDTLKESKGMLSIVKFNPLHVELYEYIAAVVIVITCLIGYKGLIFILLIIRLHLHPKYTTKWRKTSSISTVYQLRADSRFLNGVWAV